MLVDHFWKIIFAAVVGVLCWFWWKDASAKKLHTSQIAYIAELIDVSEGNEPKSNGEATERFFQTLEGLQVISFRQGEDFDLSVVLDEAITAAEIPGGVDKALKWALSDAYETADKKLLLFEDDDALSRLEEGTRPKITKGAWAGQWAEVGYYIPPSIDESVANRLCNRNIVPASVNSIDSRGIVTAKVKDWAEKLKRAQLLDIVAHKRITTEYNALRKAAGR